MNHHFKTSGLCQRISKQQFYLNCLARLSKFCCEKCLFNNLWQKFGKSVLYLATSRQGFLILEKLNVKAIMMMIMIISSITSPKLFSKMIFYWKYQTFSLVSKYSAPNTPKLFWFLILFRFEFEKFKRLPQTFNK